MVCAGVSLTSGSSHAESIHIDFEDFGGGAITMSFVEPIIFVSCTFIDIEENGGSVELWNGPNLVAVETSTRGGIQSVHR